MIRLQTEAEQNVKARQTLQQSHEAQSKAAHSTYEELTQMSAQCQRKREELESAVREIAVLKVSKGFIQEKTCGTSVNEWIQIVFCKRRTLSANKNEACAT